MVQAINFYRLVDDQIAEEYGQPDMPGLLRQIGAIPVWLKNMTQQEIIYNWIFERFENLLHNYFSFEKPSSIGLPSVSYCADELNLSPNYFGDLIKKETGKPAQEYIQNKVIDIAKERVFDIDKSISEVAYELGFKYPQHFTRLFKQKVGVSPNEYRTLN